MQFDQFVQFEQFLRLTTAFKGKKPFKKRLNIKSDLALVDYDAMNNTQQESINRTLSALAYYVLFASLLCLLSFSNAKAEELLYTITSMGEMDLDTDLVTTEGQASQYLGMYVSGAGEAILEVQVGTTIAAKSITFRDSTTRVVSYLLHNLGEELGGVFKRGLTGTVIISVSDENSVLMDFSSVKLDVKASKKIYCGKYKSGKKKGKKKLCKQIKIESLNSKQRTKFATELVQSLRGPIYLEP